MKKYYLILVSLLSLCVSQSKAQTQWRNDAFYIRTYNVISNAELQNLELPIKVQSIECILPVRNNAKQQTNVTLQNVARIQRATETLLRTYIVSIEPTENIPLLCEKIKRSCSLIEIAEPWYIEQLQGKFIPNDSLLNEQPMLEPLQAFEAWEVFKGDSNVIIGISDSGIMQSHEDYKGTLATRTTEIPDNSIDDDNNGYIDDYQGVNFAFKDDTTKPGDTYNKTEGHGTGTTGISSATFDNKIGVAGVGGKSKFFPMKTMPNYSGGIIYGYQSILYAAQNGIKVVNLSWGGGAYSCVAESIVEFALANDVAIVAAAGNHGTSIPFFPAAYKGVLGVGVCDPKDTIHPMTGFGYGLDIFAPGQQTRTTSNDGTYGYFCCTSGSAPIVSGVVALVRGKYPELTAEEALEHTRLSTTSIVEQNKLNAKYTNMIVGRTNMLKAVTRPPFSTPSIRPSNYEIRSNGTKVQFMELEKEYELQIQCKNHLGAGKQIKVTLSTAEDTTKAIEIVQNTTTIAQLNAKSEITIKGITLKKIKESNTPLFLRIDMEGQGEFDSLYKDFFLLPITPTEDFVTWQNDVTKFSISNKARIGFADPISGTQGVGYTYKEFCNLLFEGGLIATANSNNTAVSTTRKGFFQVSDDIKTIKPFNTQEPTKIVCTDEQAPDSTKLGLEFTIQVSPPSNNDPLVTLTTSVRNISGKVLQDVAAGYFLDWDIGKFADSNSIKLFPEALTPNKQIAQSAMIVSRPGDNPYVGVYSYSQEGGAVAQSAGLNNVSTYDNDGFTLQEKYNTLNSGDSLQWNGTGDISCVSGVKFIGSLQPNETKQFTTIFGAEMRWQTLAARIKNKIDSTVTGVPSPLFDVQKTIQMYSANNRLYIQNNMHQQQAYVVFSLQGKELLSGSIPALELVATPPLNSGVYIVRFSQQENIQARTIAVP